MTTDELTALWAEATSLELTSETNMVAWAIAIDREWPKVRDALLQAESLQAENARLTSEVARLRDAIAKAQRAAADELYCDSGMLHFCSRCDRKVGAPVVDAIFALAKPCS